MDEGKSVVVDNTNPSVSSRSDYLKLAKQHSNKENIGFLRTCVIFLLFFKEIPCRCIIFETPKEIAHHLNYVRQNMTKGDVRRVPDVGYHVFAKNFEAPTAAESFDEIITVKFSPKFDDERHETLFKHWTA